VIVHANPLARDLVAKAVSAAATLRASPRTSSIRPSGITTAPEESANTYWPGTTATPVRLLAPQLGGAERLGVEPLRRPAEQRHVQTFYRASQSGMRVELTSNGMCRRSNTVT
jgi:hypothetical protein